MRGNVEETGADVPLSKTLGADATASACGVFPDGNFVSINDINCNPSPRVIIIAKMVRQGGETSPASGAQKAGTDREGHYNMRRYTMIMSGMISRSFSQPGSVSALSLRPWIGSGKAPR